MAGVLFTLGVVYFVAHALSLSFSRTRIPDVLVLMGLGIVAGPWLHVVELSMFGQVGRVLTTLALAAILFESGTSLDLRAMWRSARVTTVLTFATAAATIALVAGLAVALLDFGWLAAALLGTILCGTSSAVVIPMVQALAPGEEAGTALILESALTDVLCIVFTFGLLQAAGQGDVQVGHVVGQTLASLVFAALIGVAGGVAWLRVWDWVRNLPNTTFSTIAASLVFYGVTEALGFSGAIAVLAFGLTLANHETMGLTRVVARPSGTTVTPEEQRFYREVVFLLKTFFFVYLGISMRFDDARGFGVAAAIVAAVYLARAVIARRIAPAHYARRDVALMSVMVPKGLAAAVLAGLPLQQGLAEGTAIQSVTFAVVLLSIVVTALAVPFIGGPRATPANGAVAAPPGGPAAHGADAATATP